MIMIALVSTSPVGNAIDAVAMAPVRVGADASRALRPLWLAVVLFENLLLELVLEVLVLVMPFDGLDEVDVLTLFES